MGEARKTLAFLGGALALVALARVTAPRVHAPALLQERGQLFFPGFTDPNAAVSLEVIEFDGQTSLARPFKVLNRDGKWTIPSHFGYPADAANRLSSIAAAIIVLKKDDVASDNPADQERCGVLDPLDETLPTTTGRGTRLTVRGKNETVLADIIVGASVEGRPNLRYMRLPGARRTYVARADHLEISTRFEDWIERNLLLVDRDDIDQIAIRNYTMDAKTGDQTIGETLVLQKTGRDQWEARGAPPSARLDAFKMNLLITSLVQLTIRDVQPKPPGLAGLLASQPGGGRMLKADVAELATKGFYLTDKGQLLSNRGEVLVHTESGIYYTLRFGELAFAGAAAPTSRGAGGGPSKPAENRYLFISANFDASVSPGTIRSDVKARLDVLRARFAPWYYVIADEDYKKIRLQPDDLVKAGAGAGKPK